MPRLFAKYSTLISITLLLAVIALRQFPIARLILVMICLVFSVARAFASVIAKHRKDHIQGRITSIVFVRNVLIEITGLLLAMILAGLLAKYIAQIITQQIGNDLTRFAASIATGLLVGMGVGLGMHPIWGRFMKASAEN